MICKKCKKEISDNAKFCPECGKKIEQLTQETLPNRFQQRDIVHTESLEFARLIYEVYREGSYLKTYGNLEEYGKKVLGISKAQVYNYRKVGAKLLDKDGNLFFETDQEWSITQLVCLTPFPRSQIVRFIEEGIVTADMPAKKIEAVLKPYREELKEEKKLYRRTY
jgi:hypothetical protein